jgi:hypothetical protein
MRFPSMSGLRCAALAAISVAFVAGMSVACSNTTSSPGDGTTPGSSGGGATPGTPPASGKSPCQLMLKADAEAALGEALPQVTEMPALGMCSYGTNDFAATAGLTVSTWVEIKKAETSGHEMPVAIAGVGDEAYSNGDLVYVRTGTQGFLLDMNSPEFQKLPDHGLAQKKVLALKILANF